MRTLRPLRFTPIPQQVVAAVHTWAGLEMARRLPATAVDLVEIRLDSLAASSADRARLEKNLPKMKAPLIITARDPREGGANALSWPQRRELLLAMIPHAALVDLELRNAKKGRDVIAAATDDGAGVMLSAHNFRSMPSLEQLRRHTREAAAHGAHVFKFAGTAERFSQFSTLIEWLAGEKRLPIATMGMGRYGKISRLTLAQGGSVLNYGFLDAANAPGQWPAPLLKKRLQELQESAP